MYAMEPCFTAQESSALYGLLADKTTDIIIKTDRDGFILHASAAVERLGLLPSGLLIWPHLFDLVHPSSADAVRTRFEMIASGGEDSDWTEFPLVSADHRERWVAMRICGITDAEGHVNGALAVLRSIEERRALQEELFAARLTDPLTGLTNRKAFVSMLDYMIERQMGGSLVLFGVDWLRAINLRYGQAAGDEVLILFADLLRDLTRSEDIISRIGDERFAVIFPRMLPAQARQLCAEILAALGDLCPVASGDPVPVSASAGVVRIGASLDETLERAEMTLLRARGKGCERLEVEPREPPCWQVRN